MLTIEDCIALSELTEEEIEAIAEHENLPEMAAAEMGNYLIHTPEGGKHIRRIILDDIQAARRAGDHRRSAKLKLVLKQFIQAHPEASVRKAERRS
ncbi:hypothetical protein C882_1029 [Caenispirillum salinarum AK4]|uniref:Uncharacterized protein n=1 Tax=Caenispirillum salinarum AK4 TaxID=1238182 RepID=K9GR47_9PROT|nr:hypothetical protein [Caenispirillum salinarum]EKV28455.1 hypothetical protein C882_1029 [Caenispirillum salinarum AK4]